MHHDHNYDDHQVAGNTGSPADRDYVNEAVDYFKNKLRSIIICIIICIIIRINIIIIIIIIIMMNIMMMMILLAGNMGREQKCRSKASLVIVLRLHQRLLPGLYH